MKNKITLLVFIFVLSKMSFSNTCTSSAGTFASWSSMTWSCSSAPTSGPPGCGDVMNVAAGTTVEISDDVDYSACATPISLNIYGTLNFPNGGVRFKLPPGSSVFVGSGGHINATFSGGGSSTLISVGGENVWTAGMGNVTGPIVLPIELLSFTAQSKDAGVVIEWSTGAEVNNDYFTIERSKDAVLFQPVLEIAGAGNSTTVQKYTAVDRNPYDGISYYRLKQTDFNGAAAYFSVVKVDRSSLQDFSFDIYPNPNNGETLNLNVDLGKGEELLLVIHDALGREIYSKTLFADQKSNSYVLNMDEHMNKGIYFITARSGQASCNKKLIIK